MPEKTTIQTLRAKVLRERKRRLQVDKFHTAEKSICGRVAEFLHYCAELHPYSVITYEEITQAIFSLGRVPDTRSKHVKSVRSQMSTTGRLLSEKYKHSLITLRGVGARASVDDADVLRESVTKDVERHRATGEKLKRTVELIDPQRLREQTHNIGDPALREEMLIASEWFHEFLLKYTRTLDQPKTAAALLPPPPNVR